MSEWIDVSVDLRNGMPHWPGDKPFQIRRENEISRGDPDNLSSFATSAHAGTHMDAPLHFVAGGTSIDRIPFDLAMGRARVIAIEDSRRVTARELERHDIGEGQRLLFKTRNSPSVWREPSFTGDFVSIAPDAARLLAGRKVKLVGVDYLSVGAYGGDEGVEVHRILLGGGVWIIEGLNLEAAQPGDYDLICLPLKMDGAEGAPARAILRPAR